MEKIGPSTMLRRALRAGVLVLAMFGVLTATTGTASAASWKAISGEVDFNGQWYIGQTTWLKVNTGTVRAAISGIPGGATFDGTPCGGLDMAVKKDGGSTWSKTVSFLSPATKDLYSYSHATLFDARYRMTKPGLAGNDNFSGKIYR